MAQRSKVTYTSLQEGEIMKEVDGFPNYYVTNQGRILTTRPLGAAKHPSELRMLVLSYTPDKRYYYANIYNEHGIRVSIRLHRLVYQYFNEKGETLKEGFVIDHIDNNKANNHINNLRQITQSENIRAYHKIKKIK